MPTMDFGEKRLYSSPIPTNCSCEMNDSARLKKQKGNDSLKKGNLEEARSLLIAASQLDPLDAETQYLLGLTDLRMGKLNEAVVHFRDALQIKPDLHAVLHPLGGALLQLGRYDEAEQCYRSLVKISPTAFAHFQLANVLLHQNHIDEAVSHYRQALALEPGRPEIYNNIGNAFRHQCNYELAEAAYREALRLNPDHPAAYECYTNLGTVQSLMNRVEDAQTSYRRALDLKPDFKRAVAGRAAILEKIGDAEQAYALLQPLLESGDVDANTAWVFAGLCRPMGKCKEAIALMERLLNERGATIDVPDRVMLHFALGKLLDGVDEYGRAFAHYREGNALAKRRFDTQAHAQHIDALISTYSPAFMARAPRATNRSQRPVFIVGMPRSGTSLVEQILASHPSVFGAGELDEMDHIVAALPSALAAVPYPQCLHSLTTAHCDQVAQRYFDYIAELSPPDATRVTDKMPYNFMHLGLITLLFPCARVIHCVRDPLDTCLSCYFQKFETQFFSYDLIHLGAYYRQYQRLMDHWKNTLNFPMLEIRYEELVADQERISRSLVAFCGLDWNERCLRFYDTRRVVATASYDQVRQPLYSRSVGRWRHYAQFLDPLRQALADKS